ncbi:unnamed protein product, partial [Meganyctiphanes norvegica]
RGTSGWDRRGLVVGVSSRMRWPGLPILLLLAATLHLVTPTRSFLSTGPPSPGAINTHSPTITAKERHSHSANVSRMTTSSNNTLISDSTTQSPLILTTISSPSTATLVVNSTNTTTISPTMTISSSRWLPQHTSAVLQKLKQQQTTDKSGIWDKHLKNEK